MQVIYPEFALWQVYRVASRRPPPFLFSLFHSFPLTIQQIAGRPARFIVFPLNPALFILYILYSYVCVKRIFVVSPPANISRGNIHIAIRPTLWNRAKAEKRCLLNRILSWAWKCLSKRNCYVTRYCSVQWLQETSMDTILFLLFFFPYSFSVKAQLRNWITCFQIIYFRVM